jgi:hypothetical protein
MTKLTVEFFSDVSEQAAREVLERHGAQVETRLLRGSSFLIAVDANQIAVLAADPLVRRIGRYPAPKRTTNTGSRAWTSTNALHNAGLDGTDVVLSLWDGDEVDDGHNDLAGRVTYGENPRTNNVSEHATHVAGTMAGAGATGQDGRGHASDAADIVSFDFWNNVPVEMQQAITAHSIVAANNSWGLRVGWDRNNAGTWVFINNQADFGAYDADAPDLDVLVRSEELVLVWSAGNDRNDPPGGLQTPTQPADWDQGVGNGGYDTVGPIATAKNIITVGAIDDATGGMSTFSGWGPTDDGRTKPDVVAPGVSISSPDAGTTGSYQLMSGTSMAAPAVTGIVGALVEGYRLEFFGTSASTEMVLPSTIKALLVHSAEDMWNRGPDFRFGWGGVDAEAAYALITRREFLEEELQSTGDVHEYSTEVPVGEDTLKATLVWDDVDGATLVNDLDLTLTSPNGVVARPWRLDPTAGNRGNPATTGIDRTNNVEQVVIANPAPGTWVTSVRAFRIDPTATPAEQSYSLVRTMATSEGLRECMDFEDLVPGTVYNFGDMFVSAGVPVTLVPFEWSNGVTTTGGRAEVGTLGRAFGSYNELGVNNVNLDFDFGATAKGLRLLFGEYGGNLNLEINGDRRNFENFADIHGQSIGGVSVAVTGGLGNDHGFIKFTGDIDSFTLGGQELWVDDVCPDSRGRHGLGISLHGGAAFPFGTLDSTHDIGPTVALDLVWAINPRWQVDLRAGFARFSGSSGVADLDVWNFSANAKFFPLPSVQWLFINGGLGQYYIDSSSWESGYNLGLGGSFWLSSHFDFEVTFNYHSTFTGSPDLEYAKAQIGFIWWPWP